MLTDAELLRVTETLKCEYGAFIPHSDLNDIIDLKKPAYDENTTIVDHDRAMEKYHWDRMRCVDTFREIMLEHRKMYLKNVRGTGYLILLPGQHAGEAKSLLGRGIDKLFEKAQNIIDNTSIQKLSLTERTELQETEIRITSFKNMVEDHHKTLIEKEKTRLRIAE